ncbi:hypothetical protein RCL_jg4979.t1 [Rhizophagus clarus]|uniref:Uncharacterized protein n=1 Tax=Rhizophagus clarus TaxID=94130 RepID=A0A8H3LB20_9GLOM|nr:hypothetical protein RCL_jg4979.t1 [Rhizophagus clarus]
MWVDQVTEICYHQQFRHVDIGVQSKNFYIHIISSENDQVAGSFFELQMIRQITRTHPYGSHIPRIIG